MEIHGKNSIGFALSASGQNTFRAFEPREGKPMEPLFHEADATEVARALDLAENAAVQLRKMSPERIAEFLLAIRGQIQQLGDELIGRVARESGLDTGRLEGERERTLEQIKLFADIVKDGSWVDARIDTALPERKPLPRPDIRRLLQPIGPVVVFGASNFPLAFSVAGGDTVAAFAARNPVVVKAHPAHPGTSELVASAISKAAASQSMPDGTFSMLHGLGPEVSLALVTNPKTRAVGFTGSQRAGRALFDAAARRPDPIPVYAEMGSVNPVFVLSEALANNAKGIAGGLFRSVTLGAGQFCTCPGLVFGSDGQGFRDFSQQLIHVFEQASPGTMLNPAIQKGYSDKLKDVMAIEGVTAYLSAHAGSQDRTEGQPGLLVTDSQAWLGSKELHEEIFGPATVLVRCRSDAEFLDIARALEGSLTATIHGTPEELARQRDLVDTLSRKAGRLVFNGYPTGVEVGYAMHHGGPYPATTDAKFTSVGAASIYRFAAPVCYQNFPEHLLPQELQNANPRNIWRTINGQLTRNPV